MTRVKVHGWTRIYTDNAAAPAMREGCCTDIRDADGFGLELGKQAEPAGGGMATSGYQGITLW